MPKTRNREVHSVSKPENFIAFSELLAQSQTTEGKPRYRGVKGFMAATAGLLALTLAAVLMAASLSAPATLSAAGTVDEATSWWEDLPHTIEEVRLPGRTYLLDKDGKPFATLFKENRVPINLEEMSPHLIEGLIATEDSRFYEHNGLDAQGLTRAVINNILNDSVQGASTLTQQLVENLRILLADGDPEKLREAKASSIRGKLEEVRFAQGIEEKYSKDEILESYLNIVYFGNGAYGVEAAAQRYFSKRAKDLTVPEAATLVAMLKSPTAYDPINQKKASRQRRDVVMKRMVEVGFLEEAKYYQLIKHRTKLAVSKPKNGCINSPYPYYCQLVISEFLKAETLGKTQEDRQRLWDTGGYTITTPLDREAMDDAQDAVDRALGRDNRVAAGVASIQPGTGHVVAISQNRTFGQGKEGAFDKTEIVYANTPSMQVGSTFKAITAAAALEEGFDPRTRLTSNSPMSFSGFDEPPGGFKNDGGAQFGSIDMRTAIQKSVNTYFVGLTQQVGVKDVAAMARRLGMKSVPSNLTGREGSISLGSYDSDPLELAAVYATLAGRGVACDPVVMTSIVINQTKEKLNAPSGNCHQEISPAIADTVADLLLAPFSGGGTASRLPLDSGRRAAGKTGTTNGSAATWFAGFTPQLATAVWIGDPRGGTRYPVDGTWAYGSYYSTVFGGTIAGPIWRDVMNDYHRGLPKKWYPKPGGVAASMASRIVPNVEGVHLNSAVSTLLNSGFRVEIAKKTAKPNPHVTAEGYVVSQTPGGGGKAAYGDTIVLTLTAGSDTAIEVPTSIEELKQMTEERQSKTKKAKKDPKP